MKHIEIAGTVGGGKYLPPKIETYSVCVEQGFAQSTVDDGMNAGELGEEDW